MICHFHAIRLATSQLYDIDGQLPYHDECAPFSIFSARLVDAIVISLFKELAERRQGEAAADAADMLIFHAHDADDKHISKMRQPMIRPMPRE